jgi:hypothetical protein
MFDRVITMMRIVYKAPFSSVGKAIGYYNTKNPARAKSINLLEPGSGQKPQNEDFSGMSEGDIFNSLLWAIIRVQKNLCYESKCAFIWHNLGDPHYLLGAEDIAKKLNIRASVVYKHLREAKEQLRRELIRRELIEPEWSRAAVLQPPTNIIIVSEDFQGIAEFCKPIQKATLVLKLQSGQYKTIDQICQWRHLKASELDLSIRI